MTSEEIIEALRKASRIGLTAAQAAEMIGIAANTARRRAKAAGFQFVNARRVLNQAIRDEQIVTKKKVEAKKAAQTYQKRIDDIKKKAAGIKCPIERKEMIYGAALLAFERRQHDDDKRPKPPCDVVKQPSRRPVTRPAACQFSFWCDGKDDTPHDKAAWQTAQQIAAQALSGDTLGHGAAYYHTTEVSPVWASSLEHVGLIGGHIFYTDGKCLLALGCSLRPKARPQGDVL